MNLTGDGNGFDMVMMPQAMREQVPTSNFFQRGGYERNGIARRTSVVVWARRLDGGHHGPAVEAPRREGTGVVILIYTNASVAIASQSTKPMSGSPAR